jgi:hypothetical protein
LGPGWNKDVLKPRARWKVGAFVIIIYMNLVFTLPRSTCMFTDFYLFMSYNIENFLSYFRQHKKYTTYTCTLFKFMVEMSWDPLLNLGHFGVFPSFV